MTDTTEQQAVTVAQEDRGLAAVLFPTYAASILAADMDESENVQAIARYRHRLASVSSASAEGWKLVPVEATEEMVDAAIHYRPMDVTSRVRIAWRDMIAASPEPVPATNQAGEVERLRKALADHAEAEANRRALIVKHNVDFSKAADAVLTEAREQVIAAREVITNMVITNSSLILAALATQPATSQEGERERIARIIQREEFRPSCWGAGLDDICALPPTATHYAAADSILAATPTPPTLSAQDLQEAWDRVDSLPPIEFKQDEADEILAALARAQVKAS